MSQTPEDTSKSGWTRAGINLGAFLIAFAFVWIVFDNIALALLFALLFAGGGEAAQRAAGKANSSKNDD